MKSKDFTPLILWLCLFTGILVLAFLRPNRIIGIWNEYRLDPDTIFIGLYILWMLIELRVTGKDVDTEGKTTSDCGTCPLYGCGQAFTILTALWFQPVWRAPGAAHLIGLSLFLLGGCYRLWAIHTLGRFYSHRVRTTDRHLIIHSGPYRFARHPAYAGMIVANAGITVYFFNWVTLSGFLFLLVPAVLLRIVVEEKTLFGIEGYPEYAKNRKRLFPAIW